MKKMIGTALAAGAALLGTTAVTAAPANAEVSFNIGLATDYIFRGVDQSPVLTEGQAFAGADMTFAEQFYVGAWVSNVGAAAEFLEYDLYGGWKPTLGPVALDLGFIYYGYTDSGATSPFDESDSSTYELKLAGSVPVGAVTLGGQLYWTPDFGGENTSYASPGSEDNAFYYEVNAAYTFSNKATLSGALGKADIDDGPQDGYTTWNAGVTYPILDNLSIDGRYIGVDDDGLFYTPKDNTFVATIKATF